MSVIWETEEEARESVVRYGTSDTNLNTQVYAVSRTITYGPGHIHVATLTNLRAWTTYFYQVGNSEGESTQITWSKTFEMKTRYDDYKIGDSDKVRIVAYGDMGVFPHSLASVQKTAQREVVTRSVDIVLHVGDLAYAFGNFTKWNTWFSHTESISARVPYLICVGNRDEPAIVQERFVMPNERHESNPKPQNRANFYYSFDYNWVHVSAISINDSMEVGSPQYVWLENDLKLASTRVKDPNDVIQWIVLIGHTPMYSSSNGHKGGDKHMKALVEPLLLKYGVSLALWGDDHVYERSYPMYDDIPDKGTRKEEGLIQSFPSGSKPIHLLVGTGGIELDGWMDPENPPEWSAFREMTHGYVKMEASRYVMEVKFIRQKDGSIADHFTIVKKRLQGSYSLNWLPWMLPVIGAAAFFMHKFKFPSLRPPTPGENKNT